MKAYLLILFITSSLGLCAKPLFENPNLYLWFNKLYSFEEVDLEDPLLENTSVLEGDFAAIHFYWWQTLKGYDVDENTAAINLLSTKYFEQQVSADNCSDEELYMAVVTATYQGRVHMMQSRTLTSVQTYVSLVPYLRRLLKERERFDEYKLAANIYDACINEMGGHFRYMPVLLILPKAKNANAFKDLNSTSKDNPFCHAESHYFAYKIAGSLQENPEKALQKLELLIDSYPRNLVYRLEALRLRQELSLPAGTQQQELVALITSDAYPKPVRRHFLALVENSGT